MFDKDGSGAITADEIKSALGFDGQAPNKMIDELIKEVDINGDGEIQFEEFVAMMRKLTVD
jgi:Ca2+-binding EF-hand superfamily protein